MASSGPTKRVRDEAPVRGARPRRAAAATGEVQRRSRDAAAAASSASQAPPAVSNTSDESSDARSGPEGAWGLRGPFTKPLPVRDDAGFLVFADAPRFRPNMTPSEILQAGSFGGTYFRPIFSTVIGKEVKGHWRELPPEWIKGLSVTKQVASPTYRPGVNRYGVKCGQDLKAWHDQGWIRAQDPAGWFHWYCRFYQGRRSEDDERQISRWYGIAGPKGRWKTHLVKKCVAAGAKFTDESVSPVVRQTLQHWAYQLTHEEYLAVCERVGLKPTL